MMQYERQQHYNVDTHKRQQHYNVDTHKRQQHYNVDTHKQTHYNVDTHKPQTNAFVNNYTIISVENFQDMYIKSDKNTAIDSS